MSGHLYDDTSLYYITFFIGRYISKTCSLLLTSTQVFYHVNNTITAFHRYYYTYYYARRITTNLFNGRMRLVKQRWHGFINPRPPLRYVVNTVCQLNLFYAFQCPLLKISCILETQIMKS